MNEGKPDTERRAPPPINSVHDKGVVVGINLNNVLTALVIAVLVGVWNTSSKLNETMNKIATVQAVVVYRVNELETEVGEHSGRKIHKPIEQILRETQP